MLVPPFKHIRVIREDQSLSGELRERVRQREISEKDFPLRPTYTHPHTHTHTYPKYSYELPLRGQCALVLLRFVDENLVCIITLCVEDDEVKAHRDTDLSVCVYVYMCM